MKKLMFAMVLACVALAGEADDVAWIPAATLPAKSDGTEYPEEPWAAQVPDGLTLMAIRRIATAGTTPGPSAADAAVMEVSDAKYYVTTANGADEAHFTGGVWNFSTPCGSEANGNSLIIGDGAGAAARTYIDGGTWTVPALRYEAKATEENLFQIGGGAKVTVTEPSGWVYRTDNREITDKLVVTGEGSSLEFLKTFWFCSINNKGNYNNADRTLDIAVRDGATLSFTGTIRDQNGKFKNKITVDGGTLNAGNGSFFGYYDKSPSDIIVNNGTFTGSSVYFGRTSPCSLFATNSTINCSFNLGSHLAMGFEDCILKQALSVPGATDGSTTEVVIRGGGPHNGARGAGTGTNGRARMILDGCVTTGGNPPNAGTGANSVGELVLTNGATYEHDGYGNIGTGTGAWGKLKIEAGAVYNQYFWNVNVGTGVGSTGVIEVVSGGTFNHPTRQPNDSYLFQLGTAGRGEVIVNDGGIFRVRRIRVGGTATGEGHVYLNEGGLIDVINVMTNGVGYGEFHANGGTLSGREDCTTFLQDLAKAEIGEKGLTIDSAKTLRIAQPFSNMPGAAGTLTLTGAGTKTLTGASTHAKTVVAGGVATIGSMSGAVEVVNAAKLDYANGVADEVTLGGLFLGDDETVGYLAADPGDVITVTGEMDFKNAYINLSDAFAEDGDYSLFRTPGAVPASVQAAWANASVASGRIDGKAYVFSTFKDDQGVTHFRVKVAVKGDLTGERAWRADGDEGAWGTAANWQGSQVPSDNEAALFDSATAAKSVTVDGIVMPGALKFAAGGYLVSGEGAIRLSPLANGFVTASAGENEVGVGLILDGETVFTADAGAKLTLGGNISGGGLLKTGTGELVVAGTNEFVNGFTTETGRTTVRGVEAFGITDKSSVKTIVQKGGTLRIEGTEEGDAPPGTFAPNPGAKLPYIVETATPLTVSNFTRTSGCLVKRGAARLTFATGKAITLSETGNSDGTFSWAKKSPLFTFPEDGTLGSDVNYAGVNVAEGELLVKGMSATLPTVTFTGPTYVGMNTSDGVAEPRLVFDHVNVSNGNDNRPLALCKMASAEAFMTTPVLRFQNGAKSSSNRICIGAGEQGTGHCAKDVYPRLEIDSSEVKVTYNFFIDGGTRMQTTVDVRNGSKFMPSGTMQIKSPTTMLVDNSTFCNQSDGRTAISVGWAYASSPWVCAEPDVSAVFQNGAVARMGAISRQFKPNYRNTYGHKPITVAFDNARWETLDGNVRLLTGGNETIVQEVRAGGLEFKANGTVRVETPFTGVGTFTKTGTGTVWFDTAKTIADSPGQEKVGPTNELERIVTMDAAGLAVQEGVVIVSNGTIRADAVVEVGADGVLDLSNSEVTLGSLGGTGTVRNGTIPNLRLAMGGGDAFASSDLTFENCTLLGKAKVVVEGAQPRLGTAYKIGKWVGAGAPVGSWRVLGAGGNVRMIVTADADGNLTGTFEHVGLLLMVK